MPAPTRRITNLEVESLTVTDTANLDTLDFDFPQGSAGVLTSEHGSTVYDMTTYVAKSGDDANDGLTPLRPKLTIKAAIEALGAISGTKRVGTVYVGPGRYTEEPLGVTSTALGQGFRLIGSGTNPVTGTEIVMHSGAASTDDLMTFQAAENVHHMLIEGISIDMRGRGRDAIRLGRGGFNALLREVSIKNVPRWAINHFHRPVTLHLDNVTGAYCGFGQGMSSEIVTFADEGAGAYHMAQPALTQWAAGQTVRLNSSGTLPPEFSEHTDYFFVEDGSNLRLAAEVDGDPIVATSAGTGTHRLYGGDAIPDIGQVTFADTGGGAYHLANPLPRDWVAGDKVRVRSTGLIPTLLAGGTDYWLVDDDGDLHLSATEGGAPLAASSAGTGVIWLEDAYDPDIEGGFFRLDNSSTSSLSLVEIDAGQFDSCGRYPIFVEEAGASSSVSVVAVRNVETEVGFYQGVHCHDALVGVRGTSGDAKTALNIQSIQCHVAGGGINMMKALVKQLDAGPLTISLSAQNVNGAGSQYDFLLAVADQTLLVDYELAPLFAGGGPIIVHRDLSTEVALKASYGARAAGGHPHATFQVLGNGTIQMGTGASAPTTRISISSGGLLVLENLPTTNPGVAGALWNSGGQLMIST